MIVALRPLGKGQEFKPGPHWLGVYRYLSISVSQGSQAFSYLPNAVFGQKKCGREALLLVVGEIQFSFFLLISGTELV